MARRVNYKPYFFLIAFLLLIMSMNKKQAGKMREMSIGLVSPGWNGLERIKTSFISFLALPPIKGAPVTSKKLIEKLTLENFAMKKQLESLQSYLLFEDRLEEEWNR